MLTWRAKTGNACTERATVMVAGACFDFTAPFREDYGRLASLGEADFRQAIALGATPSDQCCADARVFVSGVTHPGRHLPLDTPRDAVLHAARYTSAYTCVASAASGVRRDVCRADRSAARCAMKARARNPAVIWNVNACLCGWPGVPV